MVNGSGQINLIFDMVVPFKYKEDKKAELVRTFNEKIREVGPALPVCDYGGT